MNSLEMDHDLDPVEALTSLEKAFAVTIRDEDAVRCATVGDVYDLLHSRFAAKLGAPGSCMTSMAFYRLRRALRSGHPDVDFRPDTPLVRLAGRNPRRFLRRLERDSGLRLPGPQARWLSGAGCLLAIAAMCGMALLVVTHGPPTSYFASVAGLALGVALGKFDPGALPGECATLGDLATRASTLNYGILAQSGGAVRPGELWNALTDVLSEFSAIPTTDMRRETMLVGSGS